MSAESASLEVDDLVVWYDAVPALRGTSLRVMRGQVVTLIGANGAGKSTLMKCVSGLLRPRSGCVRLFGVESTGLPPDELVARGLALVPEGRRLFGAMSVRENLELGAYACREPAERARRLERALALFPDLKGRLGAQAGTLSGGQQQMLAVGRALMSGPRLLLLDEPTIGLAPAVVDLIARCVREICAAGVDVLLVEQNAEVALGVADQAYVLEDGCVSTQGPAAKLMNDDNVRRAYMGL